MAKQSEKDRGNPFARKVKVWKILLETRQVLNKQRLAQLFFNTEKTTEAQKRMMQRTADALVKAKVVVRCDKEGNELPDWVLLRKLKNNPSEERFWRCNDSELM